MDARDRLIDRLLGLVTAETARPATVVVSAGSGYCCFVTATAAIVGLLIGYFVRDLRRAYLIWGVIWVSS